MKWSGNKLAGCLCVISALGIYLHSLLTPDAPDREEVSHREDSVMKFRVRGASDSRTGFTAAESARDRYEAARKLGMTEQEVQWIVSDFVGLGIDSQEISVDSLEGYYGLMIRRQKWLLDSLVTGFGLSEDQKSQAAERLLQLAQTDCEEFQEYLVSSKPFESEGKIYQIVDGSKVRKLTDPTYWLEREEYASRNLCELNEDQMDMIAIKVGGGWIWPRPGSSTKDFGTEERYEELDDTQSSQSGLISQAGKVFPLSMEQVDRIRNANSASLDSVQKKGGSLEFVKVLAPAQFKIMLLLRPDLAGELVSEMEK